MSSQMKKSLSVSLLEAGEPSNPIFIEKASSKSCINMKIAVALLVFPAALLLAGCIFCDAVPRIEEKNLNLKKLFGERFEQVEEESSLNTQWNFRQLWNNFKDLFNKSYSTAEEELQRFQVFIQNHRKIKQHNDEFRRGKHSYSMAMNQFGDMTREEFARTMNGFKRRYGDSLAKQNASTFLTPMNLKVPDEVDWRQHGYVTPIKNQGHCGSCWSFSSTGALEGQNFRKTGKLVSLSEQNLIDCSKDFGNEGCNGGLMDQAFQYIKSNDGIDTESSYPYQAQDLKCRFKRTDVGADDTGFTDVASGDEDKLKEAVASVGPVSVAIDASHESFQFYKKGVYNEPDCSSSQLDHGVLVVGYGTTTDGTDYWIVKNSWGTEWGDQGYIKMVRNQQNQCGIATSASYPLV